MRAYEVKTAEGSLKNVDTDTLFTVRKFAGTQNDAAKARRAIMETYGLKMSAVILDEVEIPTDKAGLLAFINDLVEV